MVEPDIAKIVKWIVRQALSRGDGNVLQVALPRAQDLEQGFAGSGQRASLDGPISEVRRAGECESLV